MNAEKKVEILVEAIANYITSKACESHLNQSHIAYYNNAVGELLNEFKLPPEIRNMVSAATRR